MFKQNWESLEKPLTLAENILGKMIHMALPKQSVHAYELLTGGCRHLNYKITLENTEKPYVLRVCNGTYDSLKREHQRSQTFQNIVPVPEIYFTEIIESYSFSLMEFKPGIRLSDLLLSNTPHNLENIMRNCGVLLSKIATYPYLPLQHFSIEDIDFTKGYQKVFEESLINCKDKLTSSEQRKIKAIYKNQLHLIPHDTKHLMHGDFNPANILVIEENGDWKISALLDWEFSFPGHFLWDVSNMLRYKHLMPQEFEIAFLEGIKGCGMTLPSNWETITTIMNIISLLDCLERTIPTKEPLKYNDIRSLIACYS